MANKSTSAKTGATTTHSIIDHKNGNVLCSSLSMADCMRKLMAIYVAKYPNKTVDEIIKDWSFLSITVPGQKGFKVVVGRLADFNKRYSKNCSTSPRASCIKCTNGTDEIYISDEWTSEVFKQVISQINEKCAYYFDWFLKID